MKFMKLGSRPDSFQTDGNNMRYVAAELATDIVVYVGDVKFNLHKFPLVSKSARLQKLISSSTEQNVIEIHDIPGGSTAFELCAKFCYGMTFTLNAQNVCAARCASEYLEMHESVEKGNLVFKIDVFLNSSIFRSWKDSITFIQTTKSLLPFSEDLKLTGRCIEAIASKASIDTSKVDFSYTYNRKKNLEEKIVPDDWWIEDLTELEIDLYKRVIFAIKAKGRVENEVIGEGLKAYAYRKLPLKGLIPHSDVLKLRTVLDTIVWLLPEEKGSVSCSFLLKLLKASVSVESGERVEMELVKRIGRQLEEASVSDLLVRAHDEEKGTYDVDLVKKIVREFVTRDLKGEIEIECEGEIREISGSGQGILSEASKLMVAKLIDGYLAEVAKDRNLSLEAFVGIAEMVSGFERPAHDGLYRAVDTYLKEHPDISKSDRKRICRLIDCKKLSPEICTHAVQNERLPLRLVVQVLFFEQVRAAASSGSSTPDLPKAMKELNCNSYGSSRSATNTNTNTDEDWDGVASAEELRTLRGELAALRLENNGDNHHRGGVGKVRGLSVSKKILAKIWSGKMMGRVENSGSDSSESLGSMNHDEAAKGTPATSNGRGRHSVS